MSDELKTLTNLLTSMHSTQNTAITKSDDHMNHLRDTLHKLSNDITGVATLTSILNNDLKEFKVKHKEDMESMHGHIDRETKELTTKIGSIETKVAVIAPRAESYGKVADNFSRAIIMIAVGAIAAAATFFSDKT